MAYVEVFRKHEALRISSSLANRSVHTMHLFCLQKVARPGYQHTEPGRHPLAGCRLTTRAYSKMSAKFQGYSKVFGRSQLRFGMDCFHCYATYKNATVFSAGEDFISIAFHACWPWRKYPTTRPTSCSALLILLAGQLATEIDAV